MASGAVADIKKEVEAVFTAHLCEGKGGLSQRLARDALFQLKLNPTGLEVAKCWTDMGKKCTLSPHRKILLKVYDDEAGDFVDDDFVDHVLTMADVNNDGVLQIEEFVDMIMERTGRSTSRQSQAT